MTIAQQVSGNPAADRVHLDIGALMTTLDLCARHVGAKIS